MNRVKKHFAESVVWDADRDFIDAMRKWLISVEARLDSDAPELELDARLDIAKMVRAITEAGPHA